MRPRPLASFASPDAAAIDFHHGDVRKIGDLDRQLLRLVIGRPLAVLFREPLCSASRPA